MALEAVYVTRHGFRSHWSVDPSTGHYSSSLKSPTDIPADQALTAYGLEQSRQLAAQLLTLRPPVGRVYSSPYYRCLQTLGPFVEGARQQQQQQQLTQVTPGPASPSPLKVRGEAGLSEWYGSAPFDHPTSAPPEKLRALFAWLDEDYTPAIEPPRRGESIGELHGRVAAAAQAIIDQCDRDGVRAVLLCTHAAVMIALGRVLTGALPQDPAAEDFGAFTCGLSVFRRRRTAPGAQPAIRAGALTAVSAALPITPLLGNEGGDRAPSQHGEWGCGAQHQPGVRGGWDCVVNSDCSFLSSGPERGWRFSDESFASSDSETGLNLCPDRKPRL